ncbi:MAG TPA: hypothetical protein VFK78_07150 [Gemmatimonadales bacterium]|nr:hypothetical protein [Gemmatimonadales bacterium]
MKHLAQERLGLLQLAIAAGDTAALSALVPDSAIPDSERTAAARAGCSSLAQSVSRLHAAIERATVGGGPPLAVDRPVVTVAAVGDTATIAATFVAARTARIPVALTVVGNGAALRVAKVNGLAVSACTGATRVGIIQGVARRTMSGGG